MYPSASEEIRLRTLIACVLAFGPSVVGPLLPGVTENDVVEFAKRCDAWIGGDETALEAYNANPNA